MIDFAEHPWSWAAEMRQAPEGGSRWNPKKDLSFVPLRPERVVEVRYDYLEGARFRHPPQFVRWRPDRDPATCGYAQLEQPTPFDVADVLAGRLDAIPPPESARQRRRKTGFCGWPRCDRAATIRAVRFAAPVTASKAKPVNTVSVVVVIGVSMNPARSATRSQPVAAD